MGKSAPDAAGSNTGDTQATQKYFDDQFDDETVLYVFRKHPIVMRMGLVYSSLALLVGPVIVLALTYLRPNDPPSMNLFFLSLLGSLILAVLVFMPSWIAWNFSVYIVTDQRLIQIKQNGLFSRSVVDMGLKQIQMVNYEVAGFNETLLGFGTIMMQTLVGDLVIHEVHHPAKTAKRIQIILREHGVNATLYDQSENSDEQYGQDGQNSEANRSKSNNFNDEIYEED